MQPSCRWKQRKLDTIRRLMDTWYATAARWCCDSDCTWMRARKTGTCSFNHCHKFIIFNHFSPVILYNSTCRLCNMDFDQSPLIVLLYRISTMYQWWDQSLYVYTLLLNRLQRHIRPSEESWQNQHQSTLVSTEKLDQVQSFNWTNNQCRVLAVGYFTHWRRF